MLNLLQVFRCLVFAIFIISNAIVTSVAVWNLSIVEGSMHFSSAATAAATYLIVVASMGLLLIFPIAFLEIAGKKTFLGRVWFELAWVGLFGVMSLIGASVMTSLSSKELCMPPRIVKSQLIASPIPLSPCASSQVLSAFSWLAAAFLIAYMTLLSILAILRSKEDSTIWNCPVRDLPLDKILGRDSMTAILPQTRKSPVIHAPRPRYIIPPLLDCRSSRNSAYEFQPPVAQVQSAPVSESWYRPSVPRGPAAFYNSSVQKALASDESKAPVLPPPVQLGKGPRQHSSPPPLGDWPRLDATSRPRTKRNYRSAVSQNQGPLARETSTAPQHSSQRPAPLSAPTVPFVNRPPVPPRISPTRMQPPGSGHLGSAGSGDSRSGSPGHHRPPPLDLSKISAYRTRSERSQARGRGR